MTIKDLLVAGGQTKLRHLRRREWSFDLVASMLRADSEPLSKLHIEELRSLVHRLADVLKFDWRAAASDSESANGVFFRFARASQDGAPTPFLPYLIFAQGLVTRPQEIVEADLDLIRVYAGATLVAIMDSPRYLWRGTIIVAGTIRIYLAAYRAEMAVALAEATLRVLLMFAPHLPQQVSECLARTVDCLYDARIDVAEYTSLVSPRRRRAFAAEQLEFIATWLAPSVEIRRKYWGQGMSREQRAEDERSRRALTHRQLSWEATVELSSGRWAPERTSQWIELASSYVAAGEPANASGAYSVIIDNILDIVQKLPHKAAALAPELCRFAEELLANLDASVDGEPRRDLLLRAIRARAAAGDGGAARILQREAVGGLAQVVAATSDEYQRGALLRGADDWLGIDWEIEWPPAGGFAQTYALLRCGAPAVDAIATEVASYAKIFVSRFGSAIAVHPRGAKTHQWIRGERAHAIAVTLGDFHAQTTLDVQEFLKTEKAPASSQRWNSLVRRMAARFGFRRLRALVGEAASGRWAIECDGNSVHMPIGGLAWEALRAEAVCVVLRTPEGATPALSSAGAHGVRAINGFAGSDDFHSVIDRLAGVVSASVSDVRNEHQLKAALAVPASLIILGCHGSNSGALGEATLDLPDAKVLVCDALAGVVLPASTMVLVMTCFGGSGFLRATGAWDSVPSMLVAAGARAVVANQWHTWSEPGAADALRSFLHKLKTAASEAAVWSAAGALSQFMTDLHAKNSDARQWCGWSLFTRREYLLDNP